MGSVLARPLTSKHLHRVGNAKIRAAGSEMQGHRLTMEDAHNITLDYTPTSSFFGIFDGHGSGGEWASAWFAKNLPLYIKKKGFSKEQITASCLEADRDFIEASKKASMPYEDTGTTAVFCILEENKKPNSKKPYKLTVANIGDSRCLIVRGAEFQSLTTDHKPGDELEARRIEAAGGHVASGRVDGILAISRALGDHSFKSNRSVSQEKQRVSAVPDIYTVELSKEDTIFLICDGVYEGSCNQDVIVILRQYLNEHPDDPAIALSKMFDIQVQRSQDNMSAIIVQFCDGSKYSSLKGEIQYVPCEYQEGCEGPDFEKCFKKFAKRYKSEIAGVYDPTVKLSEKENNQSDNTSSTPSKKGKKRKAEKQQVKAATPPIDDSDDTDEDGEETPPLGSLTPRRSERIRTKSNDVN